MSEVKDEIILRGLKEHNLKNVDLNIPKLKIVVFTGLSGSGKSSVVFDTLATESRRQMTLNYPLYVRNQMILELTIEEAMHFFIMPKILNRVSTLRDVGLGYLTLDNNKFLKWRRSSASKTCKPLTKRRTNLPIGRTILRVAQTR